MAQFTLNRKKSSFGISMNSSLTWAQIKLTNEFIPFYDGTITLADSKLRPGFGLGILYQYRFNEKLGLLTQGNLTFVQSEVDFKLEGSFDQEFERAREYVFVELPISLIYEDLSKKIGPTFTFGGKVGYDLAKSSSSPTPSQPIGSTINLGLEFGAGMAIAFEKFVIRPELIFSKILTEQDRFVGVPQASIEKHQLNQIALRFSAYGL